eukprot:scaffold803_cov310-Pinguiococcus_pyrenoidosus.AAC.110
MRDALTRLDVRISCFDSGRASGNGSQYVWASGSAIHNVARGFPHREERPKTRSSARAVFNFQYEERIFFLLLSCYFVILILDALPAPSFPASKCPEASAAHESSALLRSHPLVLIPYSSRYAAASKLEA